RVHSVPTHFPYTTLFRSTRRVTHLPPLMRSSLIAKSQRVCNGSASTSQRSVHRIHAIADARGRAASWNVLERTGAPGPVRPERPDRKSTRLNSSHSQISY